MSEQNDHGGDHGPACTGCQIVGLMERERLLRSLLYEAGERVHSAHDPALTTDLLGCSGTLCGRIAATLTGSMDRLT
jgi:hypothetical protein